MAERDEPGSGDELEAFLAAALKVRKFARYYYQFAASFPRPLCIDGREYHRRQQARRRRRR